MYPSSPSPSNDVVRSAAMRRFLLLSLALAACSHETRSATVSLATPTPAEVVDVAKVAPGARFDMRYAQSDNFLKKTVYPCARCLLRREAADALARAQTALEKDGYGLKLWDCYRPLAVQHEMWKIVSDPKWVADPKKGSVHNRGGAIDVTLVTKDGADLEVPSAHDDFTEKAYADAPASEAAAKHRAILRKALEAEGFAVFPSEWWHFNAKGSTAWPILDVPLCEATGAP